MRLFDENGNEVEVDAQGRIIRKKKVVARDGEHIRVPMMLLLDGRAIDKLPAPPAYSHADARPREAPVTDAERERRQKLYADADARVSNAWRSPPPASEGDDE